MSPPSRFADLADGGRALAPLVAVLELGAVAVLGVEPRGLPAAREVARALGTTAVALPVDRDDAGVRPRLPDGLAGRAVVVVDEGVETGTTALGVVAALREAGVVEAVLAVPVCPREVEARLGRAYDRVVAVVRPLARRSLDWHYARRE